MKQEMRITAKLKEPTALKNLVEKLASKHVDQGYSKAVVPQLWKAIEHASTQAYVVGSFDLYTKDSKPGEPISIPFTSRFLFTCIKEKYGLFSLEWSSSLS